MKRYFHYAWYAAALFGIYSSFKGYSFTGTGPWFSMFCVVAGQLHRIKAGLPETIIDRSFQSRRATVFGIASVVVVLGSISAWMWWFENVTMPANKKEALAEYLKDHAAMKAREGTK